MLTCKYALWKKLLHFGKQTKVLKVWHCFTVLQIYFTPTWIGKTWIFSPASSLHLLQSVVSRERQPSNPDSLIPSREKKTSLVLQRVLRDHPPGLPEWPLGTAEAYCSFMKFNQPFESRYTISWFEKNGDLGNRDVRAQRESHTAEERQSWDSDLHQSFRKHLRFEKIDHGCTPLFSLSKAYIGYVGGLDISLPLLYTKNLVKAFIQLAHSYMEVQPALLSWIAYRVGGLCLAPESGVQGCAGSVWNHHLMRADLGHHLPNQPSVTSCRWPAVGHNGSIYVMGNRKTLEIGTALSPPPPKTCFQHITAQDWPQKSCLELINRRKSRITGQLCPLM